MELLRATALKSAARALSAATSHKYKRRLTPAEEHSWEACCARAKKHKAEKGNWPVNRHQRESHKKGTLSGDCLSKFEDEDFVFSALTHLWEAGFARRSTRAKKHKAEKSIWPKPSKTQFRRRHTVRTQHGLTSSAGQRRGDVEIRN